MLATAEAIGQVAADPAFRADVLAGLAAPIPAIPARWLYDEAGSRLFDQITGLAEYYPTRTESALLAQHVEEIAAAIGPGRAIVELGAGSAAKTPLLLAALDPAAYVPIDISGDYLRSSAAALAARFPALPIHPLEADFMGPVELPAAVAPFPKLGFFPGSTIGNLVPASAVDLLRRMRAMLGEGALLLIGMDRIKDVSRLLAAYDDPGGITARFNRNLLERINRELDGSIAIGDFAHEARWNERLARIEMHLVAVRDTAFTVAGQHFRFARGSSIHSENSHKYGVRDARLLLLAGGWTPLAEWTDGDQDFAVILARAEAERFAP